MINENSTIDRNLHFISSLLVFLFSATLLASGKSYSYVGSILAVLSLFLLPITLKNKRSLTVYKPWFFISGYFFVTVLSLLWSGGELSKLDAPGRVILLFPVLIFLLSYPPKKEWVLKGILVGSALTGFIALYHHQILNIRAFSDFKYMVIQSGDIAVSLGVFSFIIALFYFKEKKKLLSFLALIASFLGIFASLLSGARGGWVLLPLVLLWLLIINRHLISKNMLIAITFIAIIAGGIGYKIVEKRIDAVFVEISQLTEQNNANTSSGARIEMWKSGLYAFASKPVFGIGYENRKAFSQKLVDEKKVDPIVLEFTRLHNVYIEELAIKGIIGFIALMFFFLAPLYFMFIKGDLKNNIFSQLGVTHVVLVMGYCLTQNYINHQSGMMQYLMFIVIFYTMLDNKTEKINK